MSAEKILTHLDSYCERAGNPELTAEPLNAVTNLAFIIAAIVAWRLWRGTREATFRNSCDIVLLIILLFAIGLGSGAWHIFATSDTMMLDVIPIVLFMNLFLLAAAIRILGLKWWGAVALFAVFQGLNFAAGKFLPSGFLNGTIMYLPAYAILIVIVGWSYIREEVSKHLLFSALFLWSLSLAFRTVDTELCVVVPFGTHFLWHLFNAIVLYRLLKALIMSQATSRIRQV